MYTSLQLGLYTHVYKDRDLIFSISLLGPHRSAATMSESESPRKSSEPPSLRGAEPKRKPKRKQQNTQRSKSPERSLPFMEQDEFGDVTIVVSV